MSLASHLVAGLNFSTLPQQLVFGIGLGAIYALIALGYTMVYGVLRLINFAHGEVFMLGAYVALFVSWALGFSPQAVLGHEDVVGVAFMEDLYARIHQFGADRDRERPAYQPRDDGEDQVHRSDVLVVRRIEVSPPPGRVCGFMATAFVLSRHGCCWHFLLVLLSGTE